MQTFKDLVTNNVYHYEDDVVVTNTSGIYLFKTAAGKQITTPDTLQPYVIPVPNPDDIELYHKQQALTQLKASAQAALNKSDLVATRCVKAGVAFPTAWQTYVTALRNIVNGTDTTSAVLPAMPDYPQGT